MPASRAVRHTAALLGYVCVAIAFAWPLPLHLGTALPGSPGGDTGVYVWNLWVFRHEIVQHGHLPFMTLEILALTPPVSLVLHNYTTFANILAFPLIPVLGIVTTFNAFVIGSGVLTAYAMFLFARRRLGEDAPAWIAGLLFGFSPFMSARSTGHFSLMLAAPLPIFALVLHRIADRPTLLRACAAGVVVAWAYLCDPYYAVYCLMMAVYMAVHSAIAVKWEHARGRRAWWTALLDLALVCLLGLIVGVVLRGGGRVDFLNVPVSFTHLYTPVLALTLLIALRIWLAVRPRIAFALPPLMPLVRTAGCAALACALLLAPVMYAAGSPFRERPWDGPPVGWRSSASGVDLVAFFIPNPMHVLFGRWSAGWLGSLPNGFADNVASVSWVGLVLLIVAAIRVRFRPPWRWVVFTICFALLALGPFVRVAGLLTYIPTPWALIRYLPVLGAARMPGRMVVLMTFGFAMLTAMAFRAIRATTAHPLALTVLVAVALLFELAPAPRTLYSAEVPPLYRRIAADPRPLRVLHLPFGLRDGLSSRGNFSAASQFYQTFHEKPLVGGYLSRLPRGEINRYRRNRVLRLLLRMSEGRQPTPAQIDRALEHADATLKRLRLGYVVVDDSASPQAVDFATRAFRLTFVEANGPIRLYRTPLAASDEVSR